MDLPAPTAARPYRSHKFPACVRCRQRKIRCNFDGEKCSLCREKGWDCSTSSSPATIPRKRPQNSNTADATPTKRVAGTRVNIPDFGGADRGPVDSDVDSNHDRNQHQEADSSVIVGPVMTEDLQFLKPYLRRRNEDQGIDDESTAGTSGPARNSILYLSVPRRRQGLQLAKDPGSTQKEILIQIVGPFRQDLIDLYFEYIHPAFPILDEEAIKKNAMTGISATLLCYLIAISIPFWSCSEKLKNHPRPNLLYIWNLAVAALQEDFLAPSISTVLCAMLDMIGRPVYSIVGNIVNEGRTVALTHTFGLNRSPAGWCCSDHEKRLRIRTWWGVLTNNRWSSFAHGTPPTVVRTQYDVPLPAVSDLLTLGDDSSTRIEGAESFIRLCRLSEILGDILPMAYDLRPLGDDTQKDLRRLECELDGWESAIPSYLQQPLAGDGKGPGACNLHFCFLSVRMFLARVALRSVTSSQLREVEEVRRYRLAILRNSAKDIADFVCALSSQHLVEFWLPYTAHLIASAAMILLRCTVETSDPAIRTICKQSLEDLRKRLKSARDDDGWDLGDVFLAQCDEPIARFIETPDSQVRLSNIQQEQHGAPMTTEFAATSIPFGEDINIDPLNPLGNVDADIHLPFGSLGYPFETWWAMFDNTEMASL